MTDLFKEYLKAVRCCISDVFVLSSTQFFVLIPEVHDLVFKGGLGPGTEYRVLMNMADRKSIGQYLTGRGSKWVDKSASGVNGVHAFRCCNGCDVVGEYWLSRCECLECLFGSFYLYIGRSNGRQAETYQQGLECSCSFHSYVG